MNRLLGTTLLVASLAAASLGASGCKRAENNGNEPLSQASSGVMSNSAGANGTPGSSDAANRAGGDGAASGTSAASDASGASGAAPSSAAATTSHP